MFAMQANSVDRAVIPGNAGSRGATVMSALKEPVDRRETHAVVRRRAEALKGDEMFLAAVAAIGLPAIAGKALGKARHVAIARYLGEDRRRGDRIRARIAADDGLGAAAEPRRHLVAVDQHDLGLLRQRLQRAAHGEESRLPDVAAVDLLDRRLGHGEL